MDRKKRVGVYVSSATLDTLRKMAKKEGISRNELIDKILRASIGPVELGDGLPRYRFDMVLRDLKEVLDRWEKHGKKRAQS